MGTKNSCYTYFRMVGDFEPDYVSELLNLKSEKSWRKGEIRSNGTKYDFASWEIGRCNDYEVEVTKQMRKTILLLLLILIPFEIIYGLCCLLSYIIRG